MGVSIGRIIIFLLVLDITMMGVTWFNKGVEFDRIFNEINIVTDTDYNLSTSIGEGFEDSTPDTSAVQLSKEYGDTTAIQGGLSSILLRQITKPFTGCAFEKCDNKYEAMLRWGISFFLIIVHLLSVIQIVYVIKNNKYD